MTLSLSASFFILTAIALLITSLGFYRLVYFISTGYAFSIAVMSIVTILLFRQQITIWTMLQNLGLLLWGLRLGFFLLRREFQPSYARTNERVRQQYSHVKFSRKFLIWIGVSILYVLMFSPSLYSVLAQTNDNSQFTTIMQGIGVIVLWGGLALEAIADKQKSDLKANHPGTFCNIGLYRWVRCPNYLGEILVWLGSWLMGVPFYSSFLHWGTSLVGLVCIILIMMGSTKRLEASQEERYGSQPAYQNYVRSVPVLFPWVPIYSLKNTRVYLE